MRVALSLLFALMIAGCFGVQWDAWTNAWLPPAYAGDDPGDDDPGEYEDADDAPDADDASDADSMEDGGIDGSETAESGDGIDGGDGNEGEEGDGDSE